MSCRNCLNDIKKCDMWCEEADEPKEVKKVYFDTDSIKDQTQRVVICDKVYYTEDDNGNVYEVEISERGWHTTAHSFCDIADMREWALQNNHLLEKIDWADLPECVKAEIERLG